MGPPSYSLLQSLEVRGTARVLHDDLAVEDSCAATEAGGGGNYARVPVGPVMTVARKGAHRTAVKHEHRAIAVMLDFMDQPFP